MANRGVDGVPPLRKTREDLGEAEEDAIGFKGFFLLFFRTVASTSHESPPHSPEMGMSQKVNRDI